MKLTVVKTERTDTIREIELNTPCLFKVNKHKYLYFNDKNSEVVMNIIYDNSEFYSVFRNYCEVSFEETSIICKQYDILELEKVDSTIAKELLDNVFKKFNLFL